METTLHVITNAY